MHPSSVEHCPPPPSSPPRLPPRLPSPPPPPQPSTHRSSEWRPPDNLTSAEAAGSEDLPSSNERLTSSKRRKDGRRTIYAPCSPRCTQQSSMRICVCVCVCVCVSVGVCVCVSARIVCVSV